MESKPQQVPGYFVWEAPGGTLAVHLSLDVVDRLSAEVMRGFGLVPKRGAEVGGVLLGTVEAGERTVVRIDDWKAVACEYGRGPSLLLSDDERDNLAMVVESARGAALKPVGYYRSHTRDGAMGPGQEDLELLAQHFADPNAVVLLVRPFATKVSQAGFVVREGGAFPAEVASEFAFRRNEMTGEEAPARRSMYERRPRQRGSRGDDDPFERPAAPVERAPLSAPAPDPYVAPMPTFGASAGYGAESPVLAPELPAWKPRSGWLWFPLSFIFLVLGVALGFQAALTFAPELQEAQDAKAFLLNLSAGRNGDSLIVRWDRDAPAIKAGERGVLEITDGEDPMRVLPLDQAHLREGSVIYQNSGSMVKFRLVVYMSSTATVNEVVKWAQ